MACAAFMRATSAGSFTARKRAHEIGGFEQLRGRGHLGKGALERAERGKRHGVFHTEHDVVGRYATRRVRMAGREHIGHPGAMARTRVINGDNTFACAALRAAPA